MIDNPFTHINKLRVLIHPQFTVNKIINIKLSKYALQGIQNLANKYADGSILKLISYIGTYQLRVVMLDELEDSQRQAGFEDAMENYPNYYITVRDNPSNPEDESYIQGYIEGIWTKENPT